MIVVDASVWISVLLEHDYFHRQSKLWLDSYLDAKGEIAAPNLLLAEVAAGIARRTQNSNTGRSTIQYLLNLKELYLIPIDQRLARLAAEMAADYRLRGADAFYAAMALSRNAPLLTWDQEQMTRVQSVVRARQPVTDWGGNVQGE